MNRCRKCGDEISENYGKNNNKVLRCKKCRELVNQELNGDISRPFEFYFRFYKKQNESITNLRSIG